MGPFTTGISCILEDVFCFGAVGEVVLPTVDVLPMLVVLAMDVPLLGDVVLTSKIPDWAVLDPFFHGAQINTIIPINVKGMAIFAHVGKLSQNSVNPSIYITSL